VPSSASCLEEAGTVREVVERRRADRQADESFRLLVESVRDYAIFMLDPTGHVATWNLGAERIKGYTASEIIGRHFSTFYLAEEAATGICEQELQDAQMYGRVEAEGWRLRKDGSRFWAAVTITALYDEDKTLRGFAKVTRDVTERRRVTEALLQHERLLDETQRLARLGSWEWDIEADHITWSDEMFRMFGVEREGFAPTYAAYLERLDSDDRIVADELVRRCVESGDPYIFDHRVTRPDGSVGWVQARGRAIRDASGAIVKLQGTAQDISDQRQAEEAREALAAMALRQRHALEVNDDIIQGLAVADLALNLEDYDKARDAIAETLMSARRFVTDLLGQDGEALPIAPGDLRRRPGDREAESG
jgi:PAS domain S-box-containing protein